MPFFTPGLDAVSDSDRPTLPSAPPGAPAAVVRLLLEVTTALASRLDLDDVLGEMLTRSVELANATAGTIMLFDERGQASRKIAVRYGAPYEVDHVTLALVLERGLAHWVTEHQRPATVFDTRQDPRWVHLTSDWYEPRSAVCLPLRRHKKLLGILTLTHTSPGHFHESLVEFLDAIAGQAAVAIENARLFGELQRLAVTDGLTGAFNRRHLLEQAERLFETTRPLSVLMFDLDHFKTVNDAHGHLAGDAALRAVVARAREVLIGLNAPIGRYGGEEFVVLLPKLPIEAARALAETIRAQVSGSPVETARGPVHVSVSIGVAEATPEMPDVTALINRADERLYEAKHEGRDRVRG